MYNKIFSGYQPRQVAKWRKKLTFRPHPQGTSALQMVLETLVFSAIQPFDTACSPRRFYYTSNMPFTIIPLQDLFIPASRRYNSKSLDKICCIILSIYNLAP
jgi:hypothetical protein